MSGTSTPIGNFDQPLLAIVDPVSFGAVRAAIETMFSSTRVSEFLRSLEKKNVRVRQFEAVLENNLLGNTITAQYAALGNADQGQVREFYLASLERVPAELRTRFLKLYAYY